MKNWRTKLFTILICCLATGVVLAQVSEDYDLSWNVISSGGGEMSSANYAMSSMVGQTTGLSDSNDYQLGAGYWYGAIPCDSKPAFTTVDAVIALEIAAGSRPFDSRMDVDGDGMVTSLDALMILQAAAGQIAIC
jgi:hypothetical protein